MTELTETIHVTLKHDLNIVPGDTVSLPRKSVFGRMLERLGFLKRKHYIVISVKDSK